MVNVSMYVQNLINSKQDGDIQKCSGWLWQPIRIWKDIFTVYWSKELQESWKCSFNVNPTGHVLINNMEPCPNLLSEYKRLYLMCVFCVWKSSKICYELGNLFWMVFQWYLQHEFRVYAVGLQGNLHQETKF